MCVAEVIFNLLRFLKGKYCGVASGRRWSAQSGTSLGQTFYGICRTTYISALLNCRHFEVPPEFFRGGKITSIPGGTFAGCGTARMSCTSPLNLEMFVFMTPI